MTALEEIKKALKKVYIAEWYISGVKTNGLSVVHNAVDSRMFGITAETFEAEYLVAVNPAAISELLSTLKSLQRENTALKIDASNHAADAENARRYRDDERRRAEAAEADVKQYRAALYDIATNDEYRILTAEEAQSVAQKALASAGGEDHAE